jgi:ribose/xylose/arabinose/galactoside ABC-type transport system permease subunit
MMARFNSANAAYGESYLLVTILAACSAAVNPFGGFGKVGGLFMALVLLQMISSAFQPARLQARSSPSRSGAG